MNNATMYEMWKSLFEKANNECEYDQQYIYSPFVDCEFGNTYISTNKLKDKSILFYLYDLPDNINFPKIKGLDFVVTNVPAISKDKKLIRITSKNDECLDEAFEAFTVTLVSSIKELVDCEEVVASIFDVVERYAQFFSPENERGLSKKEEQGLFGELLFIKKFIQTTGKESVINHWTGPQKNKHDFIFPNNVGVEIKTTSNQTRRNITISNENQLSTRERKKLFLSLFVLDVNPNGCKIERLIAEIENMIENPTLKKAFYIKLLESGIPPRSYQGKYEFCEVDNYIYLVDNDFPRISKEQLNPNVFEVKYKINVDMLACYEGDMYGEL